jgi:aspartyl-tRNA(Asn)/glutamyl-tRNA(Gln) amidotransferase subunit B
MSFVIDIINKKNLWKATEEECIPAIRCILYDNNKSIKEYKNGNDKALNSLIGKVLAKMNKRADAKMVRPLIISEIENETKI